MQEKTDDMFTHCDSKVIPKKDKSITAKKKNQLAAQNKAALPLPSSQKKKVPHTSQSQNSLPTSIKKQLSRTRSTGRPVPEIENAVHKTAGTKRQRLDALLRQTCRNNNKTYSQNSSKPASPPPNKGREYAGDSRQFFLNSSSKIFIGYLFVFSMALHFLLMEGVYKLSASEQTPIKKQQKISIKIAKPPEIPKDIVKIQNPKKAATELAPRKPVKQAPSEPPKSRQTVTPKNKEKHITAADLEKKGMKLVDKALNGSFPGIVFSYGDPIAFVQQMYRLGCKTILYDNRNREYSDISLFDGNIMPISRSEFSGYSKVKRVIEDLQWNPIKSEAARRLGIEVAEIEILLLVPTSLEARWLGHLSFIFEQMKMKASDVTTAEVNFQNAKLFLREVHLKDGTSRQVTGWAGV